MSVVVPVVMFISFIIHITFHDYKDGVDDDDDDDKAVAEAVHCFFLNKRKI